MNFFQSGDTDKKTGQLPLISAAEIGDGMIICDLLEHCKNNINAFTLSEDCVIKRNKTCESTQ
jgi:hypothetical protein